MVAEAVAARCGALVAWGSDKVWRGIAGAWSWRRTHIGLEAHRDALRRRERYVDDVIRVVAADQGQEGDDDVRREDEADGEYGPCTIGYSFYNGIDWGPRGRG